MIKINIREQREKFLSMYTIRHMSHNDEAILIVLRKKHYAFPTILYIVKFPEDKWMASITCTEVAREYGMYLTLCPTPVSRYEIFELIECFKSNPENIEMVSYILEKIKEYK